jgi:DNA-directed RNA polymerase specialized sigma24 family protein
VVRHRQHAGQSRPADPACPATDDRVTTTSVSAAVLDESEVDDEQARLAAESLERRQADLELRDELARAGFRGPGWDRYAWELARYGYAVMMAWLETGEIFTQCAAKGCNLGSPTPEWTIDDQVGLVNETVAWAVHSFRQHALIEGKWTPKGGATLKTYFIGACIFAFPNAYRKWLTDRATLQQLASFEYDVVDRSSPLQDPGEMAVTWLHIQEGFNNIPDHRTKCAVLLQEMGYTYTEIGEILQISSRAVDGLIRRQHERGARKRGGGRDD